MIDKNNNYENEKLSPENFEFVQQDEKIYDKRFETKPIGYFKDAMIRFSKNRVNVIATTILFTLITLSIFVPIVTSKNYTRLETHIQYLPPRIPILERFGIADGTRQISYRTIDRSTIDPETGLGIPPGYYRQFIVEGTLTNRSIVCVDIAEDCVNGFSVITIAGEKNKDASVATRRENLITFKESENPEIRVTIEELNGFNPVFDVMIYYLDDLGEGPEPVYISIGTITEPGIYTFNIFDELAKLPQFERGSISSHQTRIRLRISDELDKQGTNVLIERVEILNNTQEEAVNVYEGFTLASDFRMFDPGNGRYTRVRGERMQAAFRYDMYGHKYYAKQETYSALDYYDMMIEYADICIKTPNPDNPDGWYFSEGCPVREVLYQTESITGPDNIDYYSYELILDYARYKGFDPDNLPYYFFGTDQSGRDFFALVWLGLRTSLLLGLIVATINITVGVIYGSIEGYYGGMVDLLMERFGEILGRIPFLVWLALFMIIFGPGFQTLIIVLTISGWLGVASVTRTQFYRYKGREYVLASRTLGAKDSRIIFRHILPNGIGTIITASVLMIPGVIFAESTLSYLGFGIGYGSTFSIFGINFTGVSIGVLLFEGNERIATQTHLLLFPAIIVSILMITFNMFGNALRDAFNPSLRGSE